MVEDIILMEPMLPPAGNRELDDMAMVLAKKGSSLASGVHPILQKSIGNLIRSMNCYYSNLIEGHNTHPRNIDAALRKDFSEEPEKRNLQEEAVAHIEVQRMIDHDEAPENVASIEFLKWAHFEFCSRLPEEMLWVENPDTGEKLQVIPGELRENEVVVGRHEPPLAEGLNRFLMCFEAAYNPNNLSAVQQVIAIAASHHRFSWIHPFLDGNGRVGRLMSHAYFKHTEIGSSLWSISRGLARNVEAYKAGLMNADSPRRGDRDGRGNLSEGALINFCKFFLGTCIDQIEYMTSLLSMDEFLNRIEIYIKEEIAAKRLPKGSFSLLREAVISGEFKRGRAMEITGYKERQARDVLGVLIKGGYLVDDNEYGRGPVRLGFPIDVVERWLPLLYPAS
jgi:Fic family protein